MENILFDLFMIAARESMCLCGLMILIFLYQIQIGFQIFVEEFQIFFFQ